MPCHVVPFLDSTTPCRFFLQLSAGRFIKNTSACLLMCLLMHTMQGFYVRSSVRPISASGSSLDIAGVKLRTLSHFPFSPDPREYLSPTKTVAPLIPSPDRRTLPFPDLLSIRIASRRIPLQPLLIVLSCTRQECSPTSLFLFGRDKLWFRADPQPPPQAGCLPTNQRKVRALRSCNLANSGH